MKRKLYALKKLTPDLWALDTINLKFAQRLGECRRFSIGATYYDRHGTHHQFIFFVHPKTGGIRDARERLKLLFDLDRLNVKDYE